MMLKSESSNINVKQIISEIKINCGWLAVSQYLSSIPGLTIIYFNRKYKIHTKWQNIFFCSFITFSLLMLILSILASSYLSITGRKTFLVIAFEGTEEWKSNEETIRKLEHNSTVPDTKICLYHHQGQNQGKRLSNFISRCKKALVDLQSKAKNCNYQ